jgi:DNA repair protein SbcC/Rad50
MSPYLYSLSTVCLLKHYNQDYLLHTLRTDFTGSNGVGKSIIADLFQIVFVADTKHIKFATEGIDKKKRKIEKLPYESGIGYTLFNVMVSEDAYVTIGVAIFSNGNQLVKPFIITASLELEKDKLEQHTFCAEKLLFSTDFLKPGKEPYTLDELARILPEKHNLYIHYFNSKDDRITYYNWLYQNALLPINLVREGNLKAYAKVIQSFSKSKALDIDSSKSLIEYLFEEDELEINQEYQQQEQSIAKLLHLFKTTKEQIYDISAKQTDLRLLKEYEEQRDECGYKLDVATYSHAYHNEIERQNEFEKFEADLVSKKSRLKILLERSGQLSENVTEAERIAQREHNVLTELAMKQSLFNKLKQVQEDEQALRDIDTYGLMHELPETKGIATLLEKDVRYYQERIQNSRQVLERYNTVKAMEIKKEEQDKWLKDKLKQIEQKEEQLLTFCNTLSNLEQNNLFVTALSANTHLTSEQQAILMHLRDVLLNKPKIATAGLRYVESVDFINKLQIIEDEHNKGWWLQTGNLHEFVPQRSELLPDLSTITFSNIEQLKAHLSKEKEALVVQKDKYISLQIGTAVEGFDGYDFDIDLSDPTKVGNHKTAAQLCDVVNYKIMELQKEQVSEAAEIEKTKQEYGISLEGVEYELLYEQTNCNYRAFKETYDKLFKELTNVDSERNILENNLPYLEKDFDRASKDLEAAKVEFANEQQIYLSRYPQKTLPDNNITVPSSQEINQLKINFNDLAGKYIAEYNQIVGKFAETKDHRDIRVDEQTRNQNFSFTILEKALLGNRIATLDKVTDHLEVLNTEVLKIADELLESLVKVFGKTETFFDRYKKLVNDLNDFFRGKLISNRFYFRIEFEPAPKLDISWIEHLRRSVSNIANTRVSGEISPESFIEDFYMQYSGNKSKVTVEDLLNPKRYFVLTARLTDKNGKDIPGSTGESYTAIALLGIARLSIVQDGNRSGLRFIILEESATLDNVNFSLFPKIAKEYGYQIITMTPKPYAIGDDEGWFIHQLIPGKQNEDINYAKTMSYFRTNKSQIELTNYLKARN